ncbi:MAG: hypothetical protein HY714_01715, partial [Candidatus Omnitrophica bacterium]|nr:hypothetical protein [Candidatus Omnitrophota bacterium]
LFFTKSNHSFLAKQNKLLYRPVIGLTKIDTFKYLTDNALKEPELSAFNNVKQAAIKFHIENVGSLAAKNFKIQVRGKIGDTWLPFTEKYADKKGVPFLPKMIAFSYATVGRETLERMKKGDALIYHVNIRYDDWENEPRDDYTQKIEIKISSEQPFALEAFPVPE